MKDNSIRIFGDKNDFAICYRPWNEEDSSLEGKFAFCHLIIKNNLIGNPDEHCLLISWFNSLIGMQKHISDNKESLFPKEFEGLTEREIFETILKANQFEEEFNPEFLCLPRLDSKIWSTQNFNLDETIDPYLFYFYVKGNKINFLLEDLKRGELERSEKFIFHSVSLEKFHTTVAETTSFLVDRFPYLRLNTYPFQDEYGS